MHWARFITKIICPVILFTTSRAFTVDGPTTVTPAQVETLTWTRDGNDPTKFQFAQSATGHQLLGTIGLPITVAKEQTQGLLAMTFGSAPSEITLVAFDLSKVLPGDLSPFGPRPSAFFFDVHPITILSANPATSQTSTASPSPPLQTTSPSPTLQTTPPSPTAITSSSATDRNSGLSVIHTTASNTTSNVGTSSSSVINSIGQSTLTGFPSPSPSQTSVRSNTTAIIGGVIGGVLGLAGIALLSFVLLRRRHTKHRHSLAATMFSDTLPSPDSDISYAGIRGEKQQIIGQREQLYQQLESTSRQEMHGEALQHSSTFIQTNDSELHCRESGVSGLHNQMDDITRRVARIEAGMAPPDYTS